MIDGYEVILLKEKIKQHIHEHQREMDKNNRNFNFYEGRKIEAQVIIGMIDAYEARSEKRLKKVDQ